MTAGDLDCLLLSAPENVAYYSGYRTTQLSKQRVCVLLPKQGTPVCVFPFHYKGNAERMSWLNSSSIRFWGTVECLELPSDPVKIIVQTLQKLGLSEKTIGIESDNHHIIRLGMDLKDFDSIKSSLPKAKFASAGDVLWESRIIKSETEIQYLRKACEITCKAYANGFKSLKEGMTEKELCDGIYKAMLEEGAGDDPFISFLHIIAGQEGYAVRNPRPSDRKLKKGDVLSLDGGASYRGYHADIIRDACIGQPSKKQNELYNIAAEAQASAVKLLSSGVTVRTVYEAALKVIKEAGYGQNILIKDIGHGLGLDLHEPPRIGLSNADFKFRKGMVLAVEPALADTAVIAGLRESPITKSGEAVFIVEDNVVITDHGCDILSEMSRELYIA